MATSLVTRETAGGGASVKDAPLTNAEVDNNFITLADNKLEASSNLGDLTDTDVAKSNLDLASMAAQESNSVDITGGTITGITNLEATGGDLSGITLSSSETTITGGSIGSIDSLGVNTTAPSTVGEIRATGDIVSHFSSDIKNKENIADIPNALNTVLSIGGKTFDWSDEYINSRGGEDSYFVRKHDFGVIAQDVQEAFPLAVRERENGELAVDYVKLCSLAFAAIKELNEKVDSLVTQQRNS